MVVNRGAQSGQPAAVVGTALESDDPLQSLARAEALMARRVTLDHTAFRGRHIDHRSTGWDADLLL